MLMSLMFVLGLAQGAAAGGAGSSEQELSQYLRNWTMAELDLPATPGTGFVAIAYHEEREFVLVLHPESYRGPHFEVVVQGADDSYRPIEAPAPVTVAGQVEGFDGSLVSGSLINGKLTAIVDLGNGEDRLVIQPVTDYGVAGGSKQHVIYWSEDAIIGDWKCGGDIVVGGDHLSLPPPPEGGDADMTAEIAFDTDFEFYQKRGSNSATVIADIEQIVAAMNVIYKRDVGICHTISRIIVRDNAADPYTVTDPQSLLQQFQSHWNSSQGGVPRDLAHLMTGRSAPGGVIGIAYLSVVCNIGSAYGVSWTTFTTNNAVRVGLTSHECGHNWGAAHCCGSCSGCSTCHIMCPCIQGCSGRVDLFGASEIAQITAHKNSRSCLAAGCGGVPTEPTCNDIVNFTAKCKGSGKVKLKVTFSDSKFNGKTIDVQVGSFSTTTLTINGNLAKGSICCFNPGTYQARVIRPSCNPINVTCN